MGNSEAEQVSIEKNVHHASQQVVEENVMPDNYSVNAASATRRPCMTKSIIRSKYRT